MSVSSISSIGASSITSSSQSSKEYEEVKKKLKEYGIASTGNEATDKALLQAEEAKDKAATQNTLSTKSSTQDSSSSQAAQIIPTELNTILSQLGIATSGSDIDTLISKASDVIEEKLNEEDVSDSDKSKYTSLQRQLVQFESTQSPSAMAGASALAAMNKSLLVNS